MFDSVNELAKRLPQAEWTGDATGDWRVVEQHIANGRRLRSEAFHAAGRLIISWFRGGATKAAGSIARTPSHQH